MVVEVGVSSFQSGSDLKLLSGVKDATAKAEKSKKVKRNKPARALTNLARYFAVCVIFFALGILLCHMNVTREHDFLQNAAAKHFNVNDSTLIGFCAMAFLSRILPVLFLLVGALTYFSGAVSSATLAFSSAVGGVGVHAALYVGFVHTSAYILWTVLTLLSLLACALFARKFFLTLFVYKCGYGNRKNLLLYIVFCLSFLLLQFIISVIYAALVFAA
jgi:hypothetical protein